MRSKWMTFRQHWMFEIVCTIAAHPKPLHHGSRTAVRRRSGDVRVRAGILDCKSSCVTLAFALAASTVTMLTVQSQLAARALTPAVLPRESGQQRSLTTSPAKATFFHGSPCLSDPAAAFRAEGANRSIRRSSIHSVAQAHLAKP